MRAVAGPVDPELAVLPERGGISGRCRGPSSVTDNSTHGALGRCVAGDPDGHCDLRAGIHPGVVVIADG